uniref:Uncharacterized protein n=1 Tax=Romanomermis culicivorax TaxID=13658 RepID=A0A915ID32_ROMCU
MVRKSFNDSGTLGGNPLTGLLLPSKCLLPDPVAYDVKSCDNSRHPVPKLLVVSSEPCWSKIRSASEIDNAMHELAAEMRGKHFPEIFAEFYDFEIIDMHKYTATNGSKKGIQEIRVTRFNIKEKTPDVKNTNQ